MNSNDSIIKSDENPAVSGGIPEVQFSEDKEILNETETKSSYDDDLYQTDEINRIILNEAVTRAEIAETKLLALALGIRFDALDDVISIARNYAGDDCSIEAALSCVTEKYPHFLYSVHSDSSKQINTGMPQSPSLRSSLNGVEQAFIAQNPWAKI